MPDSVLLSRYYCDRSPRPGCFRIHSTDPRIMSALAYRFTQAIKTSLNLDFSISLLFSVLCLRHCFIYLFPSSPESLLRSLSKLASPGNFPTSLWNVARGKTKTQKLSRPGQTFLAQRVTNRVLEEFHFVSLEARCGPERSG